MLRFALPRFALLPLTATGLGALLSGCSPASGRAFFTADKSTALPAGTSYALLHLYRQGRKRGLAMSYNVYVDDSVAYRARNGSKFDLRRAQPGVVRIWAETDARTDLTLRLRPGREYYVRCTTRVGNAEGRPQFVQVSAGEGRAEMARIANR